MLAAGEAPANTPTQTERPGEVRRFRVDGMDCAACAKTVGKTVSAVAGIASAEVSFGTATMFVVGDATDVDVLRAVSRAGIAPAPPTAWRRSPMRRSGAAMRARCQRPCRWRC
ncbi:MAG: heavy-metal-associated domain-containing protein [Actinobacteria bacterium]|nr:heavy-metal-associated domain-containing protein [Actinomycetota bacterium]